MKQWGFIRGVYNPCLYYNPSLDLKTLVHGDDFVSSGSRQSVETFKKNLEKRFEIKTQIIGNRPETGEVEEGRILNRIVRRTAAGWEYEPDLRHAEMIISEMGLQGSNPVATPGEDEKKHEEEENKKALDKEKARRYRGVAARANYLAQDRPDIMYAVKEICRQMAAPTVGAWRKLKRLARYLLGETRVVTRYDWQGEGHDLDGFSDSDWAGCRTTGKSTSGGALMVGSHFIKGWSRTQNSVTLSSAEAELVAVCKASAEMMGVMAMMKEWGSRYRGSVYADSSAALGITKRKGSGKLRHINIGLLWVQEKRESGELEFNKVKGEKNPADLLTKNLKAEKKEEHKRRLGGESREGRAAGNPAVQEGTGGEG